MIGLQEYLTDAEIAEAAARLNVKSVPAYRRGITRLAIREGWRQSELARPRAGREGGGGYEYHLSLLPEALQAALKREYLEAGAAEAAAAEDGAKLPAVAQGKAVAVAAPISTADLTARQREVMEARLVLVDLIEREALLGDTTPSAAAAQLLADLAAGNAPEQLARMAAKANDRSRKSEQAPGLRSLLRWVARHRRGGVAALAPRRKGKEPAAGWMRDFMQYYGRPTKPSLMAALENWQREQPQAQLPSPGQVRRALNKMPMIARERGRLGPKELKAMKSYVSRDVSTMLPAELAKTRKVVGWSAALDESANAVADALLMAVSRAGIPAIFYTDNGPGYRNAAMEDSLTGLLARLSITPMHALPYNSQAKGVIERFNRHWTELAREFGTYMGRDMDREAASLMHKTTRRELAQSGISASLPSWAAFCAACEDMVARYNDRPHRALEQITDADGKKRHQSPNEAWAAALRAGWTPDVVSAAELAELRLVWEVRQTRRGVVELFGNQYYARELERYHGLEVIAAYSPTDAESIICREISLTDGERKPGALIGKAIFAGHKSRMVPLSASEKAMEKRHKGRRARLGKKVDEADAELRQMVIEALTSRPMPQIAMPPAAIKAPAPAKTPPQKPADPNRRPRFEGDLDYAAWLLANPDRITAQDRANIKEDLLATFAMQERLKQAGIDLAALSNLAKSAAA